MKDKTYNRVVAIVFISICCVGAFFSWLSFGSSFDAGVKAGEAYIESFPIWVISGKIVGVEQSEEVVAVSLLFGTFSFAPRSLVFFDNATLTEDNQTTVIHQKMLSIYDFGLLESYVNETVTLTVKYKGLIPGYCVMEIEAKNDITVS